MQPSSTSVVADKTEATYQRFWHSVQTGNPNECWEWIGRKRNKAGYGAFRDENGRVQLAHRWLMNYFAQIAGKPLTYPDDVVCHTCDNKGCVNICHLYVGTPAQNVADAIERSGHPAKARREQTHCRNGHEYTPMNTQRYGPGKTRRYCRICKSEVTNRNNKKRRAALKQETTIRMGITRLRPYPTDEQLAAIYAQPHAHHHYPDHLRRVEKTIDMGVREVQQLVKREITIADMSCGDAAIAQGIRERSSEFDVKLFLGDYAPGYPAHGPIEETIETLGVVDLFVCCETLEHVKHPLKLLRQIRRHTRRLLLSTPIENWGDGNPEHIWSWDQSDVEEILATAGFIAHRFEKLDLRPEGFPYCWGIWMAS